MAAQPFSYLILMPLCVHTGQGYHLRIYLRILDLRMATSCAVITRGEYEPAQLGCSQQFGMVLGFLELCSGQNCLPQHSSSRATLNQVRGGQAGLDTLGSIFHARQKLPHTITMFGPVSPQSCVPTPLETERRKTCRSACHSSFSSCGRGRCQSAGGLCLRVHTRACFRAAWTLARSLSQRDRCAKETLVTSHLTWLLYLPSPQHCPKHRHRN